MRKSEPQNLPDKDHHTNSKANERYQALAIRFGPGSIAAAVFCVICYAALYSKSPSAVSNRNAAVVHLKIGTVEFGFPRAFLSIFDRYKDEQSVILLHIALPDFTPKHDRSEIPTRNSGETLLLLGLVTQRSARWISPEQRLQNIPPYELVPSQFELQEVHNRFYPDLAYNTRQFLGSVDGQSFLIRCSYSRVPGSVGPCGFDFPYEDLSGTAQFPESYLFDWKNIYLRTIALLNAYRE